MQAREAGIQGRPEKKVNRSGRNPFRAARHYSEAAGTADPRRMPIQPPVDAPFAVASMPWTWRAAAWMATALAALALALVLAHWGWRLFGPVSPPLPPPEMPD